MVLWLRIAVLKVQLTLKKKENIVSLLPLGYLVNFSLSAFVCFAYTIRKRYLFPQTQDSQLNTML